MNPTNLIDLTGKQFNRLRVLSRGPSGKKWKVRWNCLCDCGTVTLVSTNALRSNGTKSCGCIQREKARQNGLAKAYPSTVKAASDVFSNYRYRAEKLKIQFDLTREFFEEVIFQRCYYCGRVGSNSKEGVKYNGVDRLDPAKGYVKANLVPCCADCNYAKLDKTHDEFIDWVHRTSNYLRAKCQTS